MKGASCPKTQEILGICFLNQSGNVIGVKQIILLGPN